MAVSPQPALYPTGNDAATGAAIALLIHYFDLAPASAQLLVKKWLTNYPAIWVRAAVTEALYQGRYKPFSVEQILAFWQRRGKSISHFNVEFETLISVPLQGSFKTETNVAMADAAVADIATENQSDLAPLPPTAPAPETADRLTTGAEPALAPSTTLAEALEAAEQDQSADDKPLPRPRLMLPGELPGKGLAQRATVAKNHTRPLAERSPSEPQLPGASALSQPQGFEGVLDPRPRPQVTQGPDSALVAAAKSKQIQPPPIGRFTPAADPSGFASRLKTVVEQAIAKTQDEKEQLSLETAIASQLASDPILGQPSSEEALTTPDSPGSDADSQRTVAAIADPKAPKADPPEAAVQPAIDIPAQESDPWETDSITEAESTEPNATAELDISVELEVSVSAIPLEQLSTPEQPGETEKLADLEQLADPEQPPAPDLPAEAASKTDTEDPAHSQEEMAIAQPPEMPHDVSIENPPTLTAPFEDRFPLTNASAPSLKATTSARDAIDIELDNCLIETRLDEEPEISLTPPDNDKLDLVFNTNPETESSQPSMDAMETNPATGDNNASSSDEN